MSNPYEYLHKELTNETLSHPTVPNNWESSQSVEMNRTSHDEVNCTITMIEPLETYNGGFLA